MPNLLQSAGLRYKVQGPMTYLSLISFMPFFYNHERSKKYFYLSLKRKIKDQMLFTSISRAIREYFNKGVPSFFNYFQGFPLAENINIKSYCRKL